MNRPVPVAGPDVLLRAVAAAGHDAAAALLALEEDAGLRFLRTAPLTGESARRRDEVVATVAAMHADLARHRDVVARARAVRGAHARPSTTEAAAVVRLLRGPSVLVQEAVPASRRGLPDGPVVARRLTPATLLARVRAAHAAVWTEAARAVAVWEAVAVALDPFDAALDEARDALTVAGDDGDLAARRATVEDAREAVTAVRREVLTDLLVHDPRRPVDPAVLAALARRVRALRDDPPDAPAAEAATAAVRAHRRTIGGLDRSGDEVVAGARPSDGTDPGHRRVDRAQPGPRV